MRSKILLGQISPSAQKTFYSFMTEFSDVTSRLKGLDVFEEQGKSARSYEELVLMKAKGAGLLSQLFDFNLQRPYTEPSDLKEKYDGWALEYVNREKLLQRARLEDLKDRKLFSLWRNFHPKEPVGLMLCDLLNIPPFVRQVLLHQKALRYGQRNQSLKVNGTIAKLIDRGFAQADAQQEYSKRLNTVREKTVVAKNIYTIERLMQMLKTGNLYDLLPETESQEDPWTKPKVSTVEAAFGVRALDIPADPTCFYCLLTENALTEIQRNHMFFKNVGVYLIGTKGEFARRTIFYDGDSGSGAGAFFEESGCFEKLFDWDNAEYALAARRILSLPLYVEALISGGWKPDQVSTVIISKTIATESNPALKDLIRDYPKFVDKVEIYDPGAKKQLVPLKIYLG